MSYWKTRGLRGSLFEEMINATNQSYNLKKLALVQKIPTPIKPVKLDNKTRTIKLAYFEEKSTVDYIGVVQGIPICFDAKDTSGDNLPLQNIHKHQVSFMEDFIVQKGIAFFLVRFSKYDEVYIIPFEELKDWWEKSKIGGRKSIPYKEFDKTLKLRSKNGYLVHYLEGINVLLEGSNLK